MNNIIQFKIDNIDDFCKYKILFIYPVGSSVDMDFFYITDYDIKVSCKCFFNNQCDLLLEFSNIENVININELTTDVISSINKFNCILDS